MKNEWISIPPAEAEKHELYGVGGWLWVFSSAIILGVLANLGAIRGAAFQLDLSLSDFLSIDEPMISFLKFSAGAYLLMALIIFWMMIVKASGFRKVASGLIIGVTPIVLVVGMANSFVGFGQMAVQSLIPWLISCAVWCTYLHRSRRVRVTFDKLVRYSDLQKKSVGPQTDKPVELIRSAPTITSDKSFAPREAQMPTDVELVNTVDEQFWADALKEVDGAERRLGLWARSFAQVKGDETQAKVFYLEVRARELAEAHQAVLREQEHLNRLKDQEERLAALTEEEKAYELLPKGFCPTCKYVQPTSSKKCPKCKVVFGDFFCVKPLLGEK